MGICWVLFFFVKVWRAKTIRAFGGTPLALAENAPAASSFDLGSPAEALSVWFPYIVLIAVVVSWTGPWSHLPAVSWFRWAVTANSSVTKGQLRRFSTSLPLPAAHRF